MVQANDSITVTPGTGATVATHVAASKEHQVFMQADPDGHLQGSLPAWGFVVPPVAAGASKVYFDLFNNEAATIVRLRKLFPIIAVDVAVAPVVGARMDFMRTSAVGTGGTAFAGPTSASKTAAAFWPFTPGNTLAAGITARVAPTGGATDQAWLFPIYLGGEETNVATGSGGAAALLAPYFNMLPELPFGQPIELTTGTGLKIIQGTVASAGNFGWFGTFTVE